MSASSHNGRSPAWLKDLPASSERVLFRDLAPHFDVHIATVRRWHKSGRLEGCVRVGGRWYARGDAIARMIQRDSAVARS